MPADQDLNQQLKSRGFQEFGEPPVTEFIGEAIDFETTQETRDGKPRLMVKVNFAEIEVLRAREQYDLPTYSPSIRYSERKPSGWSFLMESIYKALGGEAAVLEQLGGSEADTSFPAIFAEFIQGRKWHMNYSPESFGMDNKTNMERFYGVWHLNPTGEDAAAEEVAAEDFDPDEFALALIDGKNLQAFQQEVASAPQLKDTETLKEILKRTWIPKMITAKRLTKDKSAIYHKA